MKKFLAITLIAMFLLVGLAAADRLPPQQPENQLINTVEYVNVLGPVMKSVSLYSEKSNMYLHDGILVGNEQESPDQIGEVVAQTTYKDELLTNGGLFDLTYTFGYDTHNSIAEDWNLQTDTILTYASVDGSTLAGSERATLDVAANFNARTNNLRCVFAATDGIYEPAFCNKVTAESTLASVTSMAVQTTLDLRDTASNAGIPAALSYKINVDPNAAQGGQYADGQVGVTFTASIREANDAGAALIPQLTDVGNGISPANNWWNYYEPGYFGADYIPFTNYWDDEARITNYVSSTTVTGGITKLTKAFAYQSGFQL